MATLFKIVDYLTLETYGGTVWGDGVTHAAAGDPAQDLCTDGYIHAYESDVIANFMNPIHLGFEDGAYRIWQATGTVSKSQELKKGCLSLTTDFQISVIAPTDINRIAFAILCSKQIYESENWSIWTLGWLSGLDRSAETAQESAAFFGRDLQAALADQVAKAIRTAQLCMTAAASVLDVPATTAAQAAYAQAIRARDMSSAGSQTAAILALFASINYSETSAGLSLAAASTLVQTDLATRAQNAADAQITPILNAGALLAIVGAAQTAAATQTQIARLAALTAQMVGRHSDQSGNIIDFVAVAAAAMLVT